MLKGLQKMSLIDYPAKIVSTIFLDGCNFRCPYCQNPDLIKNPDKLPNIKEEELLKFLESRKKWIDGVCITGGEPTTHKDLPKLIKKIKNLNLLVKLDTNGSNPKMLEELIKRKLVDYVAMDIKAPLEKYDKAAKVKINKKNIRKSVGLIIDSGIDYEMRSTILPELHSKEDIIKIAKWLKGAKRYFLQQFRAKVTLDPKFKKCKPFTQEEMEELKKECNKYVHTEIRGV
jgi:pyruvate formate lyase activating enzyme